MPIRDRDPRPPKDDGEIIATFGKAELVHRLDGKCILRGGSESDRSAALAWVKQFMPNTRLEQ